MLDQVQAGVAAARNPLDVDAAARQPSDVVHRAQCAHLECNVASALVLQSPQEWRRWLLTYVQCLARNDDVVSGSGAGCCLHAVPRRQLC